DLADVDVAFQPGVECDRSFLAFCRAYRRANDAGQPLRAAEARAEVLQFVRAHLEHVPPHPLLCAKRQIERTYTSALYVEHLAESASMPKDRFTRRFTARFGMPPIRYRLLLRLNEAARLTWAEPHLGIRRIAERVGFEDMPYFHRAFIR